MFTINAGSLAATGQQFPWAIVIVAGVLVLAGIALAVVRVVRARSARPVPPATDPEADLREISGE